MNISFITRLAQGFIMVCLVSLIMWHVTHAGASTRGKVTVYVPRANDVLTIDNHRYPYESVAKSVVCDLEAGKHVLRLRRGPYMITEEEFTIEPGRMIILAPHDRMQRGEPTPAAKTDRKTGGSGGLAIRTMQP